MKIKITKLNFMMTVLWLSIFPFYIPWEKLFYVFQFIVSVMILIYSIREIRKIQGIFLCGLYPMVIIISCLINRHKILITQVFRGTTLALLVFDIFLLVHKYIRVKNKEDLLRLCFKLSKFYMIMNVLWTIAIYIVGNVDQKIATGFLFSKSKFNVAYMCIFFLMFYWMVWSGNKMLSKRHKRKLFLCLGIVSILLCVAVKTATGTIIVTLFVSLTYLSGKSFKIINNPVILVVNVLISMFVIFSLNIFISVPAVQNIITGLFHKDLTLTGRLRIYELIYPLLMRAGLFGNGYGSYVVESLEYHGWYNAQNGLSEIILNYGFLGAGSFLLMVFVSAWKSKTCIPALNIAIMVFIVGAIVEVPYTERFILLLALLMFLDTDSNKREIFIE